VQEVLDSFQVPPSIYSAWQQSSDDSPDDMTFRDYVINEGYIDGYGLPSQELRDRHIWNRCILLEQRRLGAPDQAVLNYLDSAEGNGSPSVGDFRHYWESLQGTSMQEKPTLVGDGTEDGCGVEGCSDHSPLEAFCRRCQKKIHIDCGQWVSRHEMECFTCRGLDDLPDIFTIEADEAKTPFPAGILDHRIEGVHPQNREAEDRLFSLQGAVYRQLDMGDGRIFTRILWTNSDKSEVIVEPINNQLLNQLFQNGFLKVANSKGIVDECAG
jgi:hypothetical protein